jgi:Subtilase family
MEEIKSISIQQNGVIKPDSKILVEFNVPVEPTSARDSIKLKGVHGTVKLSNGDKLAIWRPRSPIPEGYYTFEIDELLFKDRSKKVDLIQISLLVLDSRAKIFKNLRVMNVSRLELQGNRISRVPFGSTRDNYVEVIKAINNNGRSIELGFNKKGNKIDIKKFFDDYYKAYAKKYGKIHESLYEEIYDKKSERLAVAIWLNIRQKQSELKDKNLQEPEENRKLKKEIQLKARILADRIMKKFRSDDVRIDKLAPVVYATLSKNDILTLAKDPDVGTIFLHEPEGIDDLQDSINIANTNYVHSVGVTGRNVKIAVWECGPDIATDLVITDIYDSSQSCKREHARLTTAVIKNKQTVGPHGHAPDCIMHSANSKDLDALAWAVNDKECTVISQSFHRNSEQTSSVLSLDDVYKDWLVLHWPYPTILQAAGNGTQTEYVNHKGYNSLAIGSHNDSAGDMAGDSAFRNPSSSHGDRELPELCANGTNVSAVGSAMSGTSFAAPAVAGISALMQSVNSSLKIWPEGCRAILLAGAKKNVTAGTWWNDVINGNDSMDGSGAVNAYESCSIAENRVLPNGIALRGWDARTLSSANFGSDGISTFIYHARVPIYGIGTTLKVALAWDSKVDIQFPFGGIVDSLTVDLDLEVYDENGNLVAYSYSWNNSYEIVEIGVRAGKTYTIKIRRYSGTDSTWFGIAWTVYGFIFGGVPDIVGTQIL